MARKLHITAILLMAMTIGVLCYQVFDFLIEGDWPAVPVRTLWEAPLGELPDNRWYLLSHVILWFGSLPVVLAGTVLSYAVFLLSDLLRRP